MKEMRKRIEQLEAALPPAPSSYVPPSAEVRARLLQRIRQTICESDELEKRERSLPLAQRMKAAKRAVDVAVKELARLEIDVHRTTQGSMEWMKVEHQRRRARLHVVIARQKLLALAEAQPIPPA